jgi:hypothetical protein
MRNFHKEIYQVKKAFIKFFDPFLVLAILVVFAVPIITVLNLTPSWEKTKPSENVLGTTDQDHLSLIPNQTTQEGIQVTEINEKEDTSYSFTITHLAHRQGKYQNKIFDISNPTQKQRQVAINPAYHDIPTETKISILIDEAQYIIHDTNGTLYPTGIYIQPGENLPVYLVIESKQDVHYVSNFALDIKLE